MRLYELVAVLGSSTSLRAVIGMNMTLFTIGSVKR